MKFSGLSAIFIFFSALIVHINLIAQPVPSGFEARVDKIFAEWNSTHSPGGVVGVVREGKLVFSKAYGMASLEYDVTNTTNTIFNIASVSKQITAFSMVLLEQQGKLSLDDEIQKYLPEVPDFGEKITIRHLLHHTSGLRNFQNMLAMAGWREGESMTNEDLLRFLSRQKELNFKPGDEYLYCNTGFNICTAIVERLTEQSFQDWTRANIFEPLGMLHSGYREDMELVHKNTATSYDGSLKEGFRQPLKYWTYMGNGNVYTTIDDLSKWLNNFRDPKVGGRESIEKLVTPGVLNDGKKLTYGLGIGVGQYRGLDRYSHGGSVGGYRSNMVYFPKQEVGIIVLSNFSSAGVGGKVTAMVNILLEDAFTEEAARPASPQVISRKKTTLDPQVFEPYLGNYFVDGVIAELTRQKDQMFIYAEGQMPTPVPLSPSSETTFFAEGIDLAIRIVKPKDNNPRRIQIQFQGDRHGGYQLAKQVPKDLLGEYYSPELDTRYIIVEDGSGLVVQHQRHADFELFPVSEDRLFGTAYVFADVQVVRKATGEITGLKVSNGRVRNMWFEKR